MTQSLQFREILVSHRPQIMILVGLSLGIVALTTVAHASDRLVFQRWLGRINPILASSFIVLLGGVVLLFLLRRGWFAVYSEGHLSRFLLVAGLAGLMAIIMILIDRQVILPADLNVEFPVSLSYYPVVGYAVEILFHVLPLTLVLLLLSQLGPSMSLEALIWPAILLVALAEPIFQTVPFVGTYPTWAVAVIGLHLWVFNLIQLGLFRRYDFVSMYSFRFAYYIVWHVIWGHLRLGLLF